MIGYVNIIPTWHRAASDRRISVVSSNSIPRRRVSRGGGIRRISPPAHPLEQWQERIGACRRRCCFRCWCRVPVLAPAAETARSLLDFALICNYHRASEHAQLIIRSSLRKKKRTRKRRGLLGSNEISFNECLYWQTGNCYYTIAEGARSVAASSGCVSTSGWDECNWDNVIAFDAHTLAELFPIQLKVIKLYDSTAQYGHMF